MFFILSVCVMRRRIWSPKKCVYLQQKLSVCACCGGLRRYCAWAVMMGVNVCKRVMMGGGGLAQGCWLRFCRSVSSCLMYGS